MVRTKLFGGLAAVAALGLVAFGASADDDKPKMTIKEVMAKAHKGAASLANKAKAGEASKEELQALADMYVEMAKNPPPKGDEESWKKKSDELIKSVKGIDTGEEGAAEKFAKAVNCGACHNIHK